MTNDKDNTVTATVLPRDPEQALADPKPDDLVVWYIPQVPMKAFRYPAPDLNTAVLMLDALCRFSLFEFDNNVKPDFSSAAGISRWETDGEGGFDWYDVDDFELRDLGYDV